MTRRDYSIITLLAILAGFIWLRNTSWITTFDDTVPLLIALPLFIWLGSPWKFKKEEDPLSGKWLVLTAVLFLTGILFNLTFILGLGWSALLWTWLSSRVEPGSNPSLSKLFVLPIMAFPWVIMDATNLGWWFRLSGAWVAAKFFILTGSDVQYAGTSVVINGLPISIEAACAGLNTLQSMLIAGSVVAYLLLKDTNRFWWNLPLLFIMAWAANTLRIILLASAALLVSPEFALGSFHTWGGWLILMVMFGMCWAIFSLQEPRTESNG